MPLVFLKQFRDAVDGTRACYQAIIEADAQITRFGGFGMLPGNYEVKVEPLSSHPFVEDFGLPASRLTAKIAFYANYDFTMNMGTEAWRA
jgi:hypothetical protein